ncbi:MAG: site-2 protease family protein [Nitrospirales bacterium]|nr:site-2 protease family protein [Nitrospirales bacterium]
MTPTPIPAQDDCALPPLRGDLQIFPGTLTPEGVPTWKILDPVRHQYFQIGWTAFHILSQWPAGTAKQIVSRVTSTTTVKITVEDVKELIDFLYRHNLTREAPRSGGRGLFEQAEQVKRHWLLKTLHHYLFFRIPLCNPDRFLRATLPFVQPCFSMTALVLVCILTAFGLISVIRQWEAFTNTFLFFFSPQGLTAYVLALVGMKILHELGHAYTAVRCGCTVQTMGVGFLVMVPVLYTDTTDSWKLASRRQRAAIAAAGTVVELSLGALATFLWHLAPEGVFRSVLFVLATTSWIMGLLINLNPLLRFDGYYVLSDWVGIPNLQARAFALGRWRLRELLFAWGDPPSETLSPARQRFLIVFAWSTWVYRAVMFLGIAILVYHFFFKVLGIVLFLLEIGWFLAWPVWQEVELWWKRRKDVVQSPRGRVVLAVVAIVVLAGFLPVDSTVSMPAILQATERASLYPPAPSKVLEILVQEGELVEAGQALLVLESPSLDRQLRLIEERKAGFLTRLQREVVYQKDLNDHQVVLEALKGEIRELDGVLALKNQLIMTAPFSGKIMDLMPSLHVGRWVNTKEPLAHLIGQRGEVIHAFASEEEQARLGVGSAGWFYPDDPLRPPRRSHLKDLRHMDEAHVVIPYVASIYTGAIPVRQDDQGKLMAEYSVYRVELQVEDDLPRWEQVVRGVVHVKGVSQSFMGHVWTRAATILIRESGL